MSLYLTLFYQFSDVEMFEDLKVATKDLASVNRHCTPNSSNTRETCAVGHEKDSTLINCRVLIGLFPARKIQQKATTNQRHSVELRHQNGF